MLLYELLTGTTPFDAQKFREAGYNKMLEIIRQEEPIAVFFPLQQMEEAYWHIKRPLGSVVPADAHWYATEEALMIEGLRIRAELLGTFPDRIDVEKNPFIEELQQRGLLDKLEKKVEDWQVPDALAREMKFFGISWTGLSEEKRRGTLLKVVRYSLGVGIKLAE